MKKIAFFATTISLVVIALGIAWTSQNAVTNAQMPSMDEAKLIEHDKSITKEKIERVRQEAISIQSSVMQFVAKQLDRYRIRNSYFSDPANAGIGRRGQAGFDMAWIRGKTEIMMTVTFAFDHDEAEQLHKLGINRIAMGDFFKAPDEFGNEAILVKNNIANKKMTNVGLHFVRGRMIISLYCRNDFRKNTANEKELIEFAKMILSFLNAKEIFDDV